jgi:hypothetical protein
VASNSRMKPATLRPAAFPQRYADRTAEEIPPVLDGAVAAIRLRGDDGGPLGGNT